MAISTFCRSCGQHYQIENGVALPPFGANDPGPRFRSTVVEGDGSADVGFDNIELDGPSKADEIKPAAKRSFFGLGRLRSSNNEEAATIEPEKKPVRCFECGHIHEVSVAASSTQCARCSLYISLADQDIREQYSRNIRTRGNVTIHRKGAVIGCEIACHNLTVLGGISGSVDCSGNAIFKNSGKVLGSMHCKHIVVEKKCEVDFPQGIIAESADIYGVVRGDILCSGTVHIFKTGSVLGDASARAIVMKDGGVLTGQMHIQHEVGISLPKKGSARLEQEPEAKETSKRPASKKKAVQKTLEDESVTDESLPEAKVAQKLETKPEPKLEAKSKPKAETISEQKSRPDPASQPPDNKLVQEDSATHQVKPASQRQPTQQAKNPTHGEKTTTSDTSEKPDTITTDSDEDQDEEPFRLTP